MVVGSHTPGIWKQQNKSHKTGRHRSKGQIDVQNKGRVNVKAISKRRKRNLDKAGRRYRAQQIREKKRDEVLNRKRHVGVNNSPPQLVVIIPLHHDVDVMELYNKIQCCGKVDNAPPYETPLTTAGFIMNVPRFKHRFQFIQPHTCKMDTILDCTRLADTVLFLIHDDDQFIDGFGEEILSTLMSAGVSSHVFCTSGSKETNAKKKNATKLEITKCLEQLVATFKYQSIDSEQDTFNLLRTVSQIKRNVVGLRERRAFMIADAIGHEEHEDIKDLCTLKISGHVRGCSLNVHQLVHVPGWGSFQIKQIDRIAESCPFSMKRSASDEGTDINGNVEDKKVFIGGQYYLPGDKIGESIVSVEEKRQSLQAEADYDPLEGEQTWPTEEELMAVEEGETEDVLAMKKLKKKVPAGTSDYQAAWILDDENDWEEMSDEEMEDMSDDEADEEFQPAEEDAESQVDDDSQSVVMSEMDTMSEMYEDVAANEDELARFRDERSHELFPDEIDTPRDTAARDRFQRYRGLKSFRTSPWDYMENLPLDYARIFQFQSFDRMRKKMKKYEVDEKTSAKAGTYVTVHLLNVPKAFVENHSTDAPISLYGLFPHEEKMSVLHFALKQHGTHTIKNKDLLTFHVGFRKFVARPIFSQHTLGSKHKMQRYFPKDDIVIATVYAPITFPPANVLVFKNNPQAQDIEMVAKGTLHKIDPNRIVTKRIVLSGHPFRINKRSAVIRYMFFNPDDVMWFKPVELRTKYGRRGHIKEPLGTHGLMKCTFDAQLTSQDTVLMSLYKRVFPKWSYSEITPVSNAAQSTLGQIPTM